MDSGSETSRLDALDRARTKAYWRLIPLLFLCYMIAYVDRTNVSIAKLTMVKDLPGFDNAIIGFGAGVFFIGYFLLEIPGTILVEKWSARKWISRIMISWGIVASLTAFIGVHLGVSTATVNMLNSTFGWKLGVTEFQFYAIRFLLGLAEAGFYPGVIVYLTHWFPVRDRARALAYFFVATPIAQMISPKLSNFMLAIGTDAAHPKLMGMAGWQWIYIFWGIPAVALGIIVLVMLPDKPRQAKWLTEEEREALESELEAQKNHAGAPKHMTLFQALRHPKVLLLATAYFFVVSANYGVEIFMPSILESWYKLNFNKLTWLVIIPPTMALVGQLYVGWSSDRFKERRLHTVIPILIGGYALALTPSSNGNLVMTIVLLSIFCAGVKAYLPAFWALPNLFLSSTAAAGSIGFINSVGNLGGTVGPTVLGNIEANCRSFEPGIYLLSGSMAVTCLIIFFLGLGKQDKAQGDPSAEPQKTT